MILQIKKKKLLILVISLFAAILLVLVLALIPPKSHHGSAPSDIAPPSVATSHQGNGIKLSWKAVPQAEMYRVYRSDSEKGEKKELGTTGQCGYLDKKVASGKKMYYWVRAENQKRQSELSESVNDTLYRVYIETGHGIDAAGKWDPGASWNGLEEAKLMIPIARATAKHLRENGVYVYTDAFTENETNRDYALDFLDTHDVSAFVNIHCDSVDAGSGTMALYYTDEQKKLGECLNKCVHEYVELPDRGLVRRSDLETLVNEKVHCPSCLYETGCISKDTETIETKYDEYGRGLAKGVCTFLGIEFNEQEESNSKEEEVN